MVLDLGSLVAFRPLTLHYTSECVENRLRGKILGWDEVDEVLLSPLLFLNDVVYGRIGIL